MEKVVYIKSLGKGERKRIDFKGKKAFNYAWYYFDWTNNDVYQYGCYQAGVGDEVVIAKVAHRGGLLAKPPIAGRRISRRGGAYTRRRDTEGGCPYLYALL